MARMLSDHQFWLALCNSLLSPFSLNETYLELDSSSSYPHNVSFGCMCHLVRGFLPNYEYTSVSPFDLHLKITVTFKSRRKAQKHWFLCRADISVTFYGRSRWLSHVRRTSAAARLLGLWVKVPLRAWMSVSCVVCCAGRALCDEPITRSEESYHVCMSVCDVETWTTRRP